ncbi:MAG: purine/pyrimidine permease [Deltaproteobacteria bacterium]|nr:purine/pyrimidine permease [Deltaproteobacteria bacterium]
MKAPEFIYGLDDRPPWGHAALYGLQWAMIMFPALIIASNLCSRALQMEPAEEVRFFQLILLVSGVLTALQSLFGHRYPLLDGPATALLLTFTVLVPYGVPVIQGGTMVGGVLLVVLVWTGQLGRIIPLATPNVVGVILMLIAFSLLPHMARAVSAGADPSESGGSPLVFLFSLFLTLLIAFLSHRLRSFWKTISLLLGMGVGTVCYSALAPIHWSRFAQAPWLSAPRNLVPSAPQFYWPAVIAFSASYLAVLVNSLGSLHGIARVTEEQRLPTSIKRGILLNGIGGIVAGLFGIVGMVSYSISPGVVLANRVSSRYATLSCGLILALAAFVPKLAALLAMVPEPVVGAALCVAMGAQVGAAFSIISTNGVSGRDYFVVGVPLMIGTLVGFFPEAFMASLPAAWRVFLSNGLVVGIFLALLLEHLLLREKSPG